MKRVKKNHIIITALAIMIAAAGYINYAGDLDNIIKVKDKEKAAAVVADNVSTDSNEAEAADTDFTDEPGTVILTSAGVKSEAVAAAKLNREQVRASSIENLKSIADDAGIAEDAKKAAVEQLAKLENNADKETAIELLLSAKGFDSSVVTVSDTNVDAVINVSELSDTDKAQIEEELKEKLAESLELLTEKERRVIELYYYEDMTLKEISKILEVSESRISQLHTKALNKMRKKMGVYMNILTE